ncbi:outer membrane efflux protein [Anaerovibrio sp. JC8]|uniref:TolC family protein n=1 Tax=Anaerovibrio sp. JC8 TaxID=1240085 RepID=UPI000A0D437C|nr:TolC family protein [Anaerovibrio sp. JC8]ORT99734.1 outer membrane efflux protein [Anaerovibrio sp. JC8]
MIIKKKKISGAKALAVLLSTALLMSGGIAQAENMPLSLADSIDMALDTSDAIEASEAGRRAAKWTLSAARHSTGPVVSWNSQAYKIGGRSYENANDAHDMYGDPHKETKLSVVGYTLFSDEPVISEQAVTVGAYPYHNTFANSWNMTVPLYTGGKLEGQIRSSRYGLNRADLTLERSRQTVRFQAAEAYANLLHRLNLKRIAQQAVDMANTQLKLINDQFSEGAVAKADVLMMEVRLANYRQNLVNSEALMEVAESTLANVVGLEQDTKIQPVDVFSYEPYDKDLAACEEYAMAHRPDGLAAEYVIKAAEAQTDTAKADYRPRVNGIVGHSRASNHPFGIERNHTWEAGVGVSWNIFDNGITEAGVQKSKALEDQYRAEARNLWKNIRLETRSAYIEMKAAEANINTTAAAVKQAEESYNIAKVRYEEGVDILLSVTDAQEKLTQAQSNYSTALYQYNLYRANLEKAIGVPVELDPSIYVEAEQQGASADEATRTAQLAQ